MKDLRAFPTVIAMYGDKLEKSDKVSDVFFWYLIAMGTGVGCCQMSEAINITIFCLYEILEKHRFNVVLLLNSVVSSLYILN